MTVLVVGAGRMGIAYSRVLDALGMDHLVIGRGESSADAFMQATGRRPETGGLEHWLATEPEPHPCAIVATPIPDLESVSIALLEHGSRRLLIEKPGALDAEGLSRIDSAASRLGASGFVAYNRRFYASTRRARAMIEEDGGVVSFHFDFTELSDAIAAAPFAAEVHRAWFFANSTHVADMAFFLGGEPVELHAMTAGSLDWHPAAARFGGVGRTRDGALFTYRADWDAPGRWGVEIMTRTRRLLLQPLEELKVQKRNTMSCDLVDLHDDLDARFKPGLYRQVEAFLTDPNHPDLVTVAKQAATMVDVYQQMVRPSEAAR